MLLRLGGRTKVLQGAALAAYLDVSAKRLEVAQCLADRQAPVVFDAFVTAAGGETLSYSEPNGGSDRVQVTVKTECRAGETLLKIVNVGSAWPDKADLKVHRIDRTGLSLAVSRPMRMKENQVATFRVPKSKAGTAGIGLFVEPSWYVRPFKLDAELACG